MPQNSNCQATYLLSHKPSNLDEQDMRKSKYERLNPAYGRFSVGRPLRTYISFERTLEQSRRPTRNDEL